VREAIGPLSLLWIEVRDIRMNKFDYMYVLQGNYGYGHGWEDLTATCDKSFKSWKEIKADIRCYRENEGGTYRIIERRELNPNFKGNG
jgi:hypothetical protein